MESVRSSLANTVSVPRYSQGYTSPKLKHGRKGPRKRLRPKDGDTSWSRSGPLSDAELYNLSDEYSAETSDAMIRVCAHVDAPPEGFWNSPVEAPWGCFVGRVTDLDDPSYRLSEELRLINKLKEDSAPDRCEDNFRNEIWIGAGQANTFTSNIQTTKNHISNVLITHGNEEIVEGFVENKPISGQVALGYNDNEVVSHSSPKPAAVANVEEKKTPSGIIELSDSPDEYSYAYYEPGPAQPVACSKRTYEADRRMRHTFTTRYGTEENIYEEITDVGGSQRSRVRRRLMTPLIGGSRATSQTSLQQTLVEEEVREVQSNHRRVLGQLNLAMEAMLMPGEDRTQREELEVSAVTDLDSGFSGSSGNSASLYSVPPGKCNSSCCNPNTSSFSLASRDGKGRSSWARRGWRRLAGLAGNNKVNVLDEAHNKAGWQPQNGRASSEDSWCSASDNDLSSGDESSERSASSSTRSNGQLRQTLHKARTLCDKLRHNAQQDPQPPSRLSRWFSIRRGTSNQYEVENALDRTGPCKMPLLSEAEEEGCTNMLNRRCVPPTLPPQPPNLTPQQIKRRQILAAIVHNENSYVTTLQRLVNEYKKPLEESSPMILSNSKTALLFYKLPEMLQCHTLFRIALSEAVRTWDREERIGDVFIASFSKTVVLDVYSEFINNFSVAMDLAKSEQKRKSALSEFLQVKQMSSPDRLSFFGLMVKPVQRFPQLILLLQDLLKHTPHGHPDRMSLQLALTQLESLAEMLNERKREAEQFQAFKEMLRRVTGKFAARPLSDANRCLLREDNVTQVEFNAAGGVSKSKPRRLLLLNDLLLCVGVARVEGDTSATERLALKWTHPVTDIEVLDSCMSPTLSRMLAAGLPKTGNGGRVDSEGASSLCQEMADLMHDFEVLSRIAELARTLRGSYKELQGDVMRGKLQEIQTAIQQKDEAMSWVDSCCLQITLKNKGGREETLTFQTENPIVKKEWTTELRLAQLALDPMNSPAWEEPEQEQRPSTKMPLFVRAQCLQSSTAQTEVRCGCFYTTTRSNHHNRRQLSLLWVCTSDSRTSQVLVLSQPQHAAPLRPVVSFELPREDVICMEHVRVANDLASDQVWLGTQSGRVLMFSGGDVEGGVALGELIVNSAVQVLRAFNDQVFAALSDGSVTVFSRGEVGAWTSSPTSVVRLGSAPVTSLLPINNSLYAACDNTVSVLCGYTGHLQKRFSVQHGSINLLAHAGVGLWISLTNSSTICLYHTETFKHLQDINIASNVLRVAGGQCGGHGCASGRPLVTVTALLACKGLLWVGTSLGICLTVPLPRLEGVPIISGRVNISYHAHFGPVTFLLPLQTKVNSRQDAKFTPTEKTVAERARQQLAGSPILRRRVRCEPRDDSHRASKTLPRGLGGSASSSQGSADCDVYGLYTDLIACRDGTDDTGYESLRRSDPDLTLLGSLDRRLRRRKSRPRSLDLSNWSLTSHASSPCSSSSDDSVPQRVRRAESVGALPAEINASVKVEQVLERKSTSKGSSADRKTVTTIMGGRGYVNWRQACCGKGARGSTTTANSSDAHLVIWETKL